MPSDVALGSSANRVAVAEAWLTLPTSSLSEMQSGSHGSLLPGVQVSARAGLPYAEGNQGQQHL